MAKKEFNIWLILTKDPRDIQHVNGQIDNLPYGEYILARPTITTAWLQKHQIRLETAFVYKDWLDNGGDKDYIRPSIFAWLQVHGTNFEASFVYQSWLDTGGDKDCIRVPVLAWIKEHGMNVDARFVFRAWLNANVTVAQSDARCFRKRKNWNF